MGNFCGKTSATLAHEDIKQAPRDRSSAEEVVPARKFTAADLLDTEIAAGDPGALLWLNSLVGTLWPKILKAIDNVLVEQVKPQIREQLPSALQSSFDMTAEFGSQPPVVGPIKVYRTTRPQLEDGPKLMIVLEHCPECNLNLKFGLLSAGVRLVKLTGAVIVSMNPVVDKLPVVAGVDAYCPDVPRFDLDFTGIANIADTPGIARIVRSAIEDAVSRAIVLPHKFSARWSQDELNHFDVQGQIESTVLPLGVLRVRVVRCTDLDSKADWSFLGKAKIEPYVCVRLGDKTFHCMLGTNGEPADLKKSQEEFAVFDTSQQLRVDVYDADTFSSDDLVGHYPPMNLVDALKPGRSPIVLQEPGKPDKDAGHLWLEMQWLMCRPHLYEAERCMVMVSVSEVVLPSSWKLETVSLRAKHKTVQKEAKCGPPQLEKKAPAKPAQAELQRIEKSLLDQGVDPKVVAKAMQPPENTSPHAHDVRLTGSTELWFLVDLADVGGELLLSLLSGSKQVATCPMSLDKVKMATGLLSKVPVEFSHLTRHEKAEAQVQLRLCGLYPCEVDL